MSPSFCGMYVSNKRNIHLGYFPCLTPFTNTLNNRSFWLRLRYSRRGLINQAQAEHSFTHAADTNSFAGSLRLHTWKKMEDPTGTAPCNLCWPVYHMQSDWETCGGFHTSVNYTAEVSPCDPLSLNHEQHFLVPLSRGRLPGL